MRKKFSRSASVVSLDNRLTYTYAFLGTVLMSVKLAFPTMVSRFLDFLCSTFFQLLLRVVAFWLSCSSLFPFCVVAFFFIIVSLLAGGKVFLSPGG